MEIANKHNGSFTTIGNTRFENIYIKICAELGILEVVEGAIIPSANLFFI